MHRPYSHTILLLLVMRTGVSSQAKGSAYVEYHNTKVVCSVFDPREIPNKSEYSINGELYCEFKFAPFSTKNRHGFVRDAEEREYSVYLRRALEPAVMRVSFFIHTICVKQIWMLTWLGTHSSFGIIHGKIWFEIWNSYSYIFLKGDSRWILCIRSINLLKKRYRERIMIRFWLHFSCLAPVFEFPSWHLRPSPWERWFLFGCRNYMRKFSFSKCVCSDAWFSHRCFTGRYWFLKLLLISKFQLELVPWSIFQGLYKEYEIIDPTYSEEQCCTSKPYVNEHDQGQGTITVSYMKTFQQITEIIQSGIMYSSCIEKYVEKLIAENEKIYELSRQCLVKSILKHLKEKNRTETDAA